MKLHVYFLLIFVAFVVANKNNGIAITATTKSPILSIMGSTSTTTQPRRREKRSERAEREECECLPKENFIYHCNNEWLNYKLDTTPTVDGIYMGEYGCDNPQFVGASSVIKAQGERGTARIQIKNPKGAYQVYNGREEYINDTNRMWFLKKDCNHQYTWINVTFSEKVKFGVDVLSKNINGFTMYVGRKIMENGKVAAGIVVPYRGVMYWADDEGQMYEDRYGEVLVCKSKVYEENKTVIHPNPTESTSSSKCVHEWKEFKGNNDPNVDGISAGLYDVNNKAFVGRVLYDSMWKPGRIQTTNPSGIAITANGRGNFIRNESYYLYKNPKYTYSWVSSFGDSEVANAVIVKPQESGLMKYYIGRAQIDGQMRVAPVTLTVGFLHERSDGLEHYMTNFEVLTCEPTPKNPCKQIWKAYRNDNSPENDGVRAGLYWNKKASYVARSINKYVHGNDIAIGRCQTSPLEKSGVYTLNPVSGTEKFDPYLGEYLVKNSKDSYNWVNAKTGEDIPFALKVKSLGKHCDHHRENYFIGRIFIDNFVHVGTVYREKGLHFFDYNGFKSVVSSFQVLTCTSPEINDEEEEKVDDDNHHHHHCNKIKDEF